MPRKRRPKDENESVMRAVREVYLEDDSPVLAKGRKRDGKLRPSQARIRQQRKEQRARETGGKTKCAALNLFGEPCKASPLRKGTVITYGDGSKSEPATGGLCSVHDPQIDSGAFRRLKAKRVRRPLDLLAEAVNRAPGLLFAAQFEALGLEWDPDTQELKPAVDSKTGKRSRGATHVGFSREGVAKRSRHKDYALQERIADKLADRLFGKPRQAVEIASGSGEDLVEIPQTSERAIEVAEILGQCGALPVERAENSSNEQEETLDAS